MVHKLSIDMNWKLFLKFQTIFIMTLLLCQLDKYFPYTLIGFAIIGFMISYFSYTKYED